MTSAQSEQKVPFLAGEASDEEEREALSYNDRYREVNPSPFWSWKYNIIIHVGLIAIYTAVTFLTIRKTGLRQYIPMKDALQHEIPINFKFTSTIFHNLTMSPYAGEKPETDLEISWKDLLRPMNMRFSQEEFNLVNQDSVALPEGGGYLGWFGVFHNLHCVKMIRESFERARQCNSSEEVTKKDKSHVDHCIELLRQTAVCRPDTSLTSFIWHPSTSLPMFNVSESMHTCVDWKQFMETTMNRVVSEEEMGGLQNPLLQ